MATQTTKRTTDQTPTEIPFRFEVDRTPDNRLWRALVFGEGNDNRGHGYDGFGIGETIELAVQSAVENMALNMPRR